MISIKHRSKKSSASALLLVLWAISILSFAVMGLVRIVNSSAAEAVAYASSDRAQELAESGLAIAMHPDVLSKDKVLKQEFGMEEYFDASYLSEAARLQVNHFLEKDRRDVLTQLFKFWGLSPLEADTVYDCLADWVDYDDGRRLNGAEWDDYKARGFAYGPSNQFFKSVEEMSLVMNIDLLSKKKKNWKEYFTVWTDGKLDVNTVSSEVLASVTGVSIGEVNRFIKNREELQKISDRTGEKAFKTVEEVTSQIAFSPEYLSVDSGLRRIKSVGHAGRAKRTIEVVISLKDVPLRYLEWREG